jgi:transporter family-2 protein
MILLGATILGPRLGAAAFLSLVVLGQLAASLILDHFGWLGFAQHSISLSRLAGAGLLIAGVLLVAR